MTYKLALPPTLDVVHPVFHVSMLRKYHNDRSHMLDFSSIQFDNDLSYVENPVVILDRQLRKLRSRDISLVKVQWRGHLVEKATWDTKHDMHSSYPHLFSASGLISFVPGGFGVDSDP
ncbi:uncharacterized protein LOC142171660 [Nicotiana tabacum]|uniref:Uncharacterized protein LOC142171660 n=1 Tax=Nicotiana tabacum TaxID=4097 RepID=A0AC58T2K1_TOBAC